MFVAGRLTVRTGGACISGDLIVVGGDGSAFAISAEIFCRIKAERSGIADASDAAASIAGAVGLRGVFQDADAVTLGDRADGVHIHGTAI